MQNAHIYYKTLNYILITLVGIAPLCGQDVANIGQQDPFKISGSIGGGTTFFNADGRQANREPFSWVVQGNANISVYGLEMPFSFTFSEQNRDFRQPFNQFGLSPTYKWATAHLGYRNLIWSQYSLAGHNFFGAGLELMPGNFRFGAVYGRFLRAIEPTANTTVAYQTPAFKRIGGALKLGYGTQDNNLDIIVFKAQDDENSIDISNIPPTLTPNDNVVASVTTHHVFFKKLFFDAEYAQSVFSPNRINRETDTLNNDFANAFAFLIKEKEGTRVGDAIHVILGYKEKNFEIKLKYNRVDPNFKSLGAYFFLTDLEKITIEPRLKLWKNKLVIGGSYGMQKDNLSKEKNAQTKRNIYSANINFMPVQQYNLNANYTNYGITQRPGTVPLNDQIQLSQVNQQLNVSQNLNFTGKNDVHFILLLWNFQDLSDDNTNTSQFSEFKSNMLSPIYTYTYMPWSLTAGVGYNYTIFELASRTTKNYGPSANISKSFKKPNLNMSSSFNYYQVENDGIKDSDAFIVSFQSKYKVGKKHQFSGRFHINNGNTSGINPLNYSETKIDFGYVYSF